MYSYKCLEFYLDNLHILFHRAVWPDQHPNSDSWHTFMGAEIRREWEHYSHIPAFLSHRPDQNSILYGWENSVLDAAANQQIQEIYISKLLKSSWPSTNKAGHILCRQICHLTKQMSGVGSSKLLIFYFSLSWSLILSYIMIDVLPENMTIGKDDENESWQYWFIF